MQEGEGEDGDKIEDRIIKAIEPIIEKEVKETISKRETITGDNLTAKSNNLTIKGDNLTIKGDKTDNSEVVIEVVIEAIIEVVIEVIIGLREISIVKKEVGIAQKEAASNLTTGRIITRTKTAGMITEMVSTIR